MRTARLDLLATSLIACVAIPGIANACEFYRTAESRMEIYDLPSSGSGLAVAVLPSDASACVMEEKKDQEGHTWQRVEFYTSDNVKYNSVGWILASSDAPSPQTANLERLGGPDSNGAGSDQEAFFERPWQLDPERSHLNFVSIKKGSIVETHEFKGLSGTVEPDGKAKVTISLDSVSTGIDIRDVRMRFLLFDIDSFPEATITAQLDRQALSGLIDGARIEMELPVTVSLRGKEKELTIPVAVSKLGEDLVSVASVKPTMIETSDFDLEPGMKMLSEAAGSIDITRSSPVTFNLSFVANDG